jgi:hypothetical protein
LKMSPISCCTRRSCACRVGPSPGM